MVMRASEFIPILDEAIKALGRATTHTNIPQEEKDEAARECNTWLQLLRSNLSAGPDEQ